MHAALPLPLIISRYCPRSCWHSERHLAMRRRGFSPICSTLSFFSSDAFTLMVLQNVSQCRQRTKRRFSDILQRHFLCVCVCARGLNSNKRISKQTVDAVSERHSRLHFHTGRKATHTHTNTQKICLDKHKRILLIW